MKKLDDDQLTSLNWLMRTGKSKSPFFDLVSSTAENDQSWKKLAYADYSVDDIKPPHSYAQLIIMAMKAHNGEKIVLGDIYRWIREHFAFYRNGDNSWQNSIRHNLSLNSQFVKVPREKNDKGKGSYWMLDRSIKDPYCIRTRKFFDAYRPPRPTASIPPQINPVIKNYLECLERGERTGDVLGLINRKRSKLLPVNRSLGRRRSSMVRSTGRKSNGGTMFEDPIHASCNAAEISLHKSNGHNTKVKVVYNYEDEQDDDDYQYQPNMALGSCYESNYAYEIVEASGTIERDYTLGSVGMSPSGSESSDRNNHHRYDELRITAEWWDHRDGGNGGGGGSLISPNVNGSDLELAKVFSGVRNCTSAASTAVVEEGLLSPTLNGDQHPWQEKKEVMDTDDNGLFPM